MIIKVTQEHIDKGKAGDTAYCPIALALREQTGFNCYVTGKKILLWINIRGVYKEIKFPCNYKMYNFIIDFDKNKCLVEPIEIDLSKIYTYECMEKFLYDPLYYYAES